MYGALGGNGLNLNEVKFYDLMIHRPSSDMIKSMTYYLVTKANCHISEGSVWTTLLCE
jgi:hypothetical protein